METENDDRNSKWIHNMKNESKQYEESSKMNIHLESQRDTLKKIPNWKTPDYMGFDFKTSYSSTTAWPCNWVDTYKKQTCLNGWRKGKLLI